MPTVASMIQQLNNTKLNNMEKNQKVMVIATGEILVITRVDKHIYPICAGYRRFKKEELTLL